MAAQQSFDNHAKIVPAYHYFTFALIAVNLLYRLYMAATGFSTDALMSLLLAIGVVMVFFWARVFALRVQDRVIRLEMRLRLMQLVPELGPRMQEFTINQLCGLRFASDAELPGLARSVLAEKLDDRKSIKKMIRDWQADHLRA
jgi:uncharacterized membrane protein YciS (DUF1049 family)